MSWLGQRSRPAAVKVWPVVGWVEELKNCQNCFRVHSLELSGVDTRLFQAKKLIPKDLVTL